MPEKKTIKPKIEDIIKSLLSDGDYNGAVGIVNPNYETIDFIKKLLDFKKQVVEKIKSLNNFGIHMQA